MQSDVERSIGSFPAVGLPGSRQAGKTTLARRIEANRLGGVVHLDLESPADLAKLGDPELLLAQYEDRLVVIDRHRRPGRFLILGSASPHLKRQASETLAGDPSDANRRVCITISTTTRRSQLS